MSIVDAKVGDFDEKATANRIVISPYWLCGLLNWILYVFTIVWCQCCTIRFFVGNRLIRFKINEIYIAKYFKFCKINTDFFAYFAVFSHVYVDFGQEGRCKKFI